MRPKLILQVEYNLKDYTGSYDKHRLDWRDAEIEDLTVIDTNKLFGPGSVN